VAGPGEHWDVGDARLRQITDPGIILYRAMRPSLAVNADLESGPVRSVSRRQVGVELGTWTSFVVFFCVAHGSPPPR
jgi:hypothetical protein